jgi:hypothetical protein
MSSFVTNQHEVNSLTKNRTPTLLKQYIENEPIQLQPIQLQFLKSKLDFHDKAKTNIGKLQLLLMKYKGEMTNYSDLVLAELKSSQPKIDKIINHLNPNDKQLVDDFMDMVKRLKSNNIKDNDVKRLLQNNGLVELPNVPLSIKKGGVQMDGVDNAVKLLKNIVTEFTTNPNNKKYYNIVKLNNNNNKFDILIQYAFIYYDYSQNKDAIKHYCENIIKHADDIKETLNKIIKDILKKINETDVRHVDVDEKVSDWLLEEIQKSEDTLNKKQQTFLERMQNEETVLHAKIYFFNDKLETMVEPQNESDVLTEVIGPYECSVYNNFFVNEINDIVLKYAVGSKIEQLNEEIKTDTKRDNARYIWNINLSKQNADNIAENILQKQDILNDEINKKETNKETMMAELHKLKQNVDFTKHDVLELLSTKIIGVPIQELYQEVFGDKKDYNQYFEKKPAVALVNFIINKKYSNQTIKDSLKTIKDPLKTIKDPLNDKPIYDEIISKAATLDNIKMLKKNIQTIEDEINKLETDKKLAENAIQKLANKIDNRPVKNYAVDDSKKNIVKNLKMVETTGGISIQKLLSNFSISPAQNENLNTYTFPYDWFNKPFGVNSETNKNNQKINIVKDPIFITNQNNIENLFTYGTKQGSPNRKQIHSKKIDILNMISGPIGNNPWILDTAWHAESQSAVNISLSIISENFTTIIMEHSNRIETLFSKQVDSIVFKTMNDELKMIVKPATQQKEKVTTQLKDVMEKIENEIQKEKAEIEKNTTTRGLIGAICFIFFGGILLYIVDVIFMHGTITGLIAHLISVIFSTLLAPFYAIFNFATSMKGAQTVYNSATTAFGNSWIWLGNKFANGVGREGWEYYTDNTLNEAVEGIVSELSFLHIILLVLYGAFALLLYLDGAAVKKTIGDFVFKWLAKILDFMCKIPGLNRILKCGELSDQREKYLGIINEKLQKITNKQNTKEMSEILVILSRQSINELQNEELINLAYNVKRDKLNPLQNAEEFLMNQMINNEANKKTQGGSKISRKNKYKRHYIASKRRHANIKKIRITKKMRGGNNPEIDILLRTIMAFINNIIELVLYGKTTTIDANNNMVERILDDENIFNSFFNIVYECFRNIRIPVPKHVKSQYNSPNKNETRKNHKDKND